MATAIRHPSPSFEQLLHDHFTDNKVMAYCILLFVLCMTVVALSNNTQDREASFTQPDYIPGSRPSSVIPIPTGQQSTSDYRLRV
jgi:hypothetical protein